MTGAGSAEGIGLACARLLGRLGARLLITSTTPRVEQRAGELAAGGVQAGAAIADLTDRGQAAGLVALALERYGRLDVLVNAGMTSVSAPADEAALPWTGRLPLLSGSSWDAGIGLGWVMVCFAGYPATSPPSQ